jgi:hypothetical protein
MCMMYDMQITEYFDFKVYIHCFKSQRPGGTKLNPIKKKKKLNNLIITPKSGNYTPT